MRHRQTKHAVAEVKWAAIPISFLGFWALGIGFAWWLIIPPIAAFSTRGRTASKRINLLMVLGAWLALTAIAAALTGGPEVISRIPGAAFGAICWISAGLLLYAVDRSTAAESFQLLRGLIILAAVQGAITLGAVATSPSIFSRIELPAAPLLNGIGGVAPWTIANLAYVDYFGGGIVRSSGLMATAAWSGGFACLMLLLMVMCRRRLVAAGLSNRLWVFAVLMSAASLYFSYTRVSWAIFVAVLGLFYLYRLGNWAIPRKAGPVVVSGVLASLFVIIAVFAPWQRFLSQQDSLRPGSSDSRFISYIEGFQVALNNGLFTAVAGSGVKPYLENLGRGAGSESTYVSLLVRGGFIAVVIFVSFLVTRILHERRNKNWPGILLIIALAVHALVADLDVGTLSILLAIIGVSRIADDMRTSETPNVAGRDIIDGNASRP